MAVTNKLPASRAWLTPGRIAVLYALSGAAWYLVSDLWLDTNHVTWAVRVDVLADWVYVGLTALALYFALQQQRGQYRQTQNSLRASEEGHRQLFEQLKSSHEQLRALAARLNIVRETESRRIAREVHDEFGQALTALLFDLSWLEERLNEQAHLDWTPALRLKVQNTAQTARQMVGTVRRIARELRPELLDDFGLVAAMEWQAEKFQENTGITCEFVATVEQEKFSRDAATAIFRIAQEALTNIARHANATQVNIVLEDENSYLILQVADNGQGFASRDLPSTLGLLGMKERAVLLNGEVDISSAPGQGARVTARIPLTPEGKAAPRPIGSRK